MGVNYVPMLWRRHFDHWASVHAEFLPMWLTIRDPYNDNGRLTWRFNGQIHTTSPMPGKSVKVWPIRVCNSGTFACRVALGLGYERVVLAGCPQDNSGYFWEPPGEHGYGNYNELDGTEHWERLAFETDRIRSMSGYTQQLFGGL